MCTMVVLRRPAHAWPLIVGANRDEMGERPWRAPGRHWADREEVVAGLDELAGGSWLGVNDHGVMAAVLNRHGTLGPAPDKRSRGELVLEALDHADAVQAAQALRHLNLGAWRPFNLVVADNRDAFWLRHDGEGPILVQALPPGLSMVTAHDRNDIAGSPRIRAYLPRFQAVAAPDPETGDWREWEGLLASRVFDAEAGPAGAMCIVTASGFGTVSSSLIALPAPEVPRRAPVWRFAAGRPGEAPWTEVML